MNKDIYNIKLTENTKVVFPNNKPGDIFICGFIEGMFGEFDQTYKGLWFSNEVAQNNMDILYDTIKNGNKLRVLGTDLVVNYVNNVICEFVKGGVFTRKEIEKYVKQHGKPFWTCGAPATMEEYSEAIAEKFNEIYENSKRNGMKFDYIIQNPPYKGSLHLDFLEKGLDLLKEDGKMVIIEPATWLINVRKNGRATKYDAIKKRIEGHVESVVIENLNKDFDTNLMVPFATTTIDMSKTFESIKFVCCGEERKNIKSIYDCNLIGNYNTIWKIVDKCLKFKNMMAQHITKEPKGDGVCYSKYAELTCGAGGTLCNATTKRSGGNYDGETIWETHSYGEFYTVFSTSAYHRYQNGIADKIYCSYDSGKHLTDKPTDNIYGTREELENWKHFIFNNKLPLFLNIVLTIDQNNNSKPYLPWLVNKQYTDDEINEMFGFTEEEIKLIDFTIKKYERNSPWFRRYMCGPDSVEEKEVNNFIKEISK